ncbi:bifunctional hydroxymethylpyrimidine kinase/phosphomethylpyrimidine kinase [Verrucomicrobiota bacterium]
MNSKSLGKDSSSTQVSVLSPQPSVLTIAGSDSCGGAGIQADLKTFSILNIVGTSAVTCVTAQNSDKIAGIEPVDPEMVSLQIKTVCESFSIAAAKTGMLYSASIIQAVSKTLAECGINTLVLDPVIISSSGTRLLQEDAIDILRSDFLSKATVITPNIPEAEFFCGDKIDSIEAMKSSAEKIGKEYGTACIIKGGHLGAEVRNQESGVRRQETEVSGGEVTDVLWDGREVMEFSGPRVNMSVHGTGCVFSAALTVFLAQGAELGWAVKQAKNFVFQHYFVCSD